MRNDIADIKVQYLHHRGHFYKCVLSLYNPTNNIDDIIRDLPLRGGTAKPKVFL